ncbi:MAG: DUF4838 domain-containing protein [Verrucomicrobia bacterium]|nr:DUF4838 domain-containing protein [Verrucomicrobiota bacterium]MBU1735701.1 DUF4838 domain-containing protein [Verrucomicrobiota bacterium]MBU1858076.1 DUF4838 domain-containing protein [Verrucomicrobiota bacterium]
MNSEMDIAKAVIVVSKDASAPEVFAAEELSKYVEKMSGVKLSIAKDNEAVTNENLIFIGTLKSNDKIQEIVKKKEINADKLNKDQDGFIIKTIGNKMVLMGNNPRSALYSVYAFLERQGCLWPAPGEDYVPAIKNIRIQDVDVTEQADLGYRICYGGGFNSIAWVDWLAKNRCNWIQFYGGSSPSLEEWKKQNIDMELKRRGTKVAFGLDYTVTLFLPASKYYKEHPEYYALMDGKRIRSMVCVSNPDVIRLEAENIIEFLKNNPEIGMITLSACDGYNWCDCEQCMKLDSPVIKCVRNPKQRSTSNSHAIFQNEVLKRVNKVFPDIKFNPTAYAAYAEPSRVKSQDMSKNLLFMFTFNGRCSSHAICDKDCARNQPFYSGIEGWAKWYGDKKMVIPFDLNCGMAAQRELPLAMLTTTPKDFPYYKDFGGVVIWFHGTLPGAKYNCNLQYALNDYVAMRLAWNVNEILDKILTDYFEKYYGKAGKFMRDYYMVWENIAHQSGRHCSAWDGMFLFTYVTENDVKQCENNLAMAEKASESKAIADRIMDMKYYFDFVKTARTAGSKLDSLRRSAKAGNNDRTRKEKEELLVMCAKLLESGYGERLVSDMLVGITALAGNDANRNFVFNGSFEYGRMGWSGKDKNGQKIGAMDTNEFHQTMPRGGGQCVRFDNSSPNNTCRIQQNVLINNPLPDGNYFPREPKPIKISGWSKARDVKGKGRYCIYVDFEYEDGTQSCAHEVVFDPGTHDWQYGEKVFTPEKSVKSARGFIWLDPAGTAWFDDICLEEVNPAK